MNIKSDNGLLIDTDSGSCVGYLFDFTGHGIFSPDGKVNVTKEDADKHNKLLSEGEILGMDNNCKIGQMGTFYYIKGQVQTFIGTVVSDNVRVTGKSITFTRPNGHTYRGRLRNDADCFNFKRIS